MKAEDLDRFVRAMRLLATGEGDITSETVPKMQKLHGYLLVFEEIGRAQNVGGWKAIQLDEIGTVDWREEHVPDAQNQILVRVNGVDVIRFCPFYKNKPEDAQQPEWFSPADIDMSTRKLLEVLMLPVPPRESQTMCG